MIEKKLIDFNLLPFSQRDKDYNGQDPQLAPFITSFPSLDNLIAQAKKKQQQKINRALLVEVLDNQYENISTTIETSDNIQALSQGNTFTVVTAHQPSLLTGPLYFIFKIINCINLTERLNTYQSDFKFVPVFISGGEDHDFEEIATFKLFREHLTWEAKSGGPVGRMTTNGLVDILDKAKEILGERSQAIDLVDRFKTYLSESTTYNDFQMRIVNDLFGKYGLIYMSSDDNRLKQELAPIFKQELLNRSSIKTVVPQQNKLQEIGYSDQAFVRNINLFYLKEGARERIEEDAGVFNVLNTEITFTEDDIDKHISNFSPNVVLRPLCQEYLLPNITYIGGGGELAYWLERKTQFDAFGLVFPILIRRNSAGLIRTKILDHWMSTGFKIEELFRPSHSIANDFISRSEVDFELTEEKEAISKVFETIKSRASEIDKSIPSSVEAALVKELKVLDQIESRLKKSVKQKFDVQLNKLNKVQEAISPNQKLQERTDNILTYISKYGENIIDDIKQHLDPLTDKFTLLILP